MEREKPQLLDRSRRLQAAAGAAAPAAALDEHPLATREHVSDSEAGTRALAAEFARQAEAAGVAAARRYALYAALYATALAAALRWLA
jgi:hypothetical protein